MTRPFTLAVVATSYFNYSHADVIVSRWIERRETDAGWGWTGARPRLTKVEMNERQIGIDSCDDVPTAAIQDLLERLVRVGAPTFHEANRSRFIEAWLREHVDAAVGRDELGNVWADLSGGAPSVHLLDAHIDTVFPYPQVTLVKDGDRWHAPGVIDNTASCALLMTWARRVARRDRPVPLLLSFTVAEENEGNLVGIRKLAAAFRDRLAGACVLDLRLNSACRQAVGSHRYHLRWTAAGGHSWGKFGRTSAIHAMADWIHSLKSAFPWRKGLHSYNVGLVHGGRGETSIASEAELKLDVRSIEPAFLRSFGAWLDEQIASSAVGEDAAPLSLLASRERPAGSVPQDHPLVAMLNDVHAELGVPLTFGCMSTNANALYEANIPAVTTGLTSGDGVHTEAEYLDVPSLGQGFRKLCLIGRRLAGGGA